MDYYGKLPIVLLSEIACSRDDTYRCRIASYVLGRIGKALSVEEIARDCFVSKSAVSRFCREIGLEDFGELKELQAQAGKTFERIGTAPEQRTRNVQFARLAASAMEQAASSLDEAALRDLVQDIHQAERIACFGLLKAETAAINLQSDLTMLGKNTLTKVSYGDQMDFLSRSLASDLILIFSYRGIYFEYDLPSEIRNGHGKIWIITGNAGVREKLPRWIRQYGVLHFDSSLDFASHPYQLLTVSSIIAQEVAISGNAV